MEKIVRNYLEHLERELNYSSNTLKAYETDLISLVFFLKNQGVRSLAEVKKNDLRSCIACFLNSGMSHRSVARKIASIRSFFRFLQRKKIIPFNPSLGLITPKIKSKLPVFLDERKMNAVLSLPDSGKPEGKRDAAILELFYSTGMRLGELLNLNIGDIKIREGIVKVKGKGRKERIIPVGKKALDAVKEYISGRLEIEKERPDYPGERPLFVTRSGNRMYPQAVGRLVKRYISRVSEIEKKSPHVLRHTFATHLLNRGADVRAVKELLGHESLSTTQIYAHVSTAKMKKVYEDSHPKA